MDVEPLFTILTAHCLCVAHSFSVKVKLSDLPLEASACHCTSCRHNIGALYSIDATWPKPRAEVDTSALQTFSFSPKINLLFCGTCSTPMFYENAQDPNADLGFFTGTLKNDKENAVIIKNHIFVEDTKDGGATMWMRNATDHRKEAKRFKKRPDGEEYPFDWPTKEELTGYQGKTEDSVPIRCKCAGVDFMLHRGDYTGKSKEKLPWFIDPKTHKSLGGFCVCDTCRLSSGVDIFNWTFAELKNISYRTSSALVSPFPTSSPELKALVDARDPRIGTLTYYSSSPDVQRYFCSTCSACIFYAVDERPEMVDVAIGVLHASDGARAEGMISWAFGKVGQLDDVKGGWREKLMGKVEEECEQWREKGGYPINWRRIEREEKEKKGESFY